MANRMCRGVLGRAAALAICAGIGAGVAPAMSRAATTFTPASFTDCHGSLAPDSGAQKAGEPNLLDYSFSCNGGISAYTIVVDQQRDPQGALQDFDAAPMVYESDDRTPSPTETVTCSGVLPSNGINCNTGTYLAEVSGGYHVGGTIDLTQPYCKHLPTTPKGATARPGSAAVPTARVQLIVTDWSGAEDGPFALRLPKACPSVPDRVPEPVKATHRSTHDKRQTGSSKARRSHARSTRAGR